jgi:DNA-binding SARP family transcriptional activator
MRVVTVVFVTGVLAALWLFRPPVPAVPPSLNVPPTMESIEQLGRLAAWLVMTAVLGRTLMALRRPRRTARTRSRLDARREHRDEIRRLHSSTRVGHVALGLEPVVLTVTAPTDTSEQGSAPIQPASQGAGPDTKEQRRDSSKALSISVLGPLQIQAMHQRRGLRTATEELLVYLVLRPEGATRDQLLEAIWPREDPRRSRPRLWQSVSEARRLLGEGFVRYRGRYLLDRTRIRIDLDELEELVAAGASDADPSALERAIALFRGEPLSGCDYPWADGDLHRLQATRIELLERVGRARLAAGDARGALDAAQRGLDYEPLNESLVRLAMEAEATLGLRGSIGHRYEQLSRELAQELGLEPDRRTRALYRQLLGQR